LDEQGLKVFRPTYRDVSIGLIPLRVLTVPIVTKTSQRMVGTLQVGTRLDSVQTTQRVLVWVLFIGAMISMLIAGVAGLISTGHSLAPLEDVTRTALQITRADDLSRRIPYNGPPDDEVGQLIRAFNQTSSGLRRFSIPSAVSWRMWVMNYARL